MGRVSGEKSRSEKIRDGESQKKEDARARKGRKVAIHCVFPMIWGSGGSKSNLAKAAGAEPAGQKRDEKLNAVVARSTFPCQNVQNTPGPDHFWKLRCRKSARRCGAKRVSKSKVSKTDGFGPLFDVQMSKKVHAVVAQSTFPSQKCQKLRGSGHFLTFRCRPPPPPPPPPPQQQQQQQQQQQAHYSTAASSSGHGFVSFVETDPARVDVLTVN